MKQNEIDYLQSQLLNIDINKYNFEIRFGENKVVMGMFGDHESAVLFEYKTLIKSFLNICKKIDFSLNQGIVLTYNTPVYDKFNFFEDASEEEFLANYYIENAIFRTIYLWDLLAQIYNVYFESGIDINRINYYKYFLNGTKSENVVLKSKSDKIMEYLNQNDDSKYENESKWMGNHKVVNDHRNKMTHRNAPDETTISNFDFNLKSHPSVLLRRVAEDYNQVVTWIDEILDEVIKRLSE